MKPPSKKPCFGWIDSLIQRIDDQRYARKFNVRKDYATWSESNRRPCASWPRKGASPPICWGAFPPRSSMSWSPVRAGPIYPCRTGWNRCCAPARRPGQLTSAWSVSPAHLFGLDHGCQTPGNARTAGGRSRPPPRAGPGIGIEVTGPAQLQVNLWYESTDVPIFPDMLPPPQPYAV